MPLESLRTTMNGYWRLSDNMEKRVVDRKKATTLSNLIDRLLSGVPVSSELAQRSVLELITSTVCNNILES